MRRRGLAGSGSLPLGAPLDLGGPKHKITVAFEPLGAARASIEGLAFERITTDPEVMGGLPCIRGLRMPVATVVAMVADGMTNDEMLAEHPDLTQEDIHKALLYAAEAVRERELRGRRSR